MSRFLVLSFAMLSCTLFASLSAPFSASAASPYDDLILRTNTLKLSQEFGPDYESTNYSLTFTDVDALLSQVNNHESLTQGDETANFVGETGNNAPAVWASYANKKDYAVVNYCTNPNGYGGYELCSIRVMWVEEPNEFTANWTETSITLSSPEIKHIIEIQSNTSLGGYVVHYKLFTNEFDSQFTVARSDRTNSLTYLYDNQVSNRNYPIDYDGILFEDAVPPTPNVPLSDVPNWYVLESKDWHIKVRDSNFNTFDNPAFLCDDELAPILNYTVFSGKHESGGTVLSSGVISPTVLIEFDVPEEPGWYTITGQYECGDNSPAFSEIGYLEIEMAANGSHINQIFDECVTTEFPFVNFQGCYNNVMTFANMLAFNQLKFGTDFTPPNGCRNLVVLGSWINASTNTVCPMIPEYIRNVVTPFVTFLLGLLMVKFITRSTGAGF